MYRRRSMMTGLPGFVHRGSAPSRCGPPGAKRSSCVAAVGTGYAGLRHERDRRDVVTPCWVVIGAELRSTNDRTLRAGPTEASWCAGVHAVSLTLLGSGVALTVLLGLLSRSASIAARIACCPTHSASCCGPDCGVADDPDVARVRGRSRRTGRRRGGGVREFEVTTRRA